MGHSTADQYKASIHSPPCHGHRLYCDGSKHKPLLRGYSHAFFFLTTPVWAYYLLRECTSTRAKVDCSLFMLCWAAQYGFSAAWHCLPWSTVEMEVFINHLDHVGIFLMIAGSVLPLLPALDNTGLVMGGLMWASAIAGSLNTLGILGKRSGVGLQTTIYIGMGALCLLSAVEMSQVLTPVECAFALGSVSQYFLGGVIYATRSFDYFRETFGYHEIFHALTCSASVCTYLLNLHVTRREAGQM